MDSLKRSAFQLGLFVFLAVLFLPGTSAAGTSGTLKGKILDQDKQPLPGATVMIEGQPLGAFADADGNYMILNVPAGKFNVKFTMISYRTLVMSDVEISANETTTLDGELTESAVEIEEMVVRAEKPIVDLKLTSNLSTVTRDEMELLPVQELDEIVELQAGVVDGHFRGGRIGEVQYQVDGVSVNNAFNNQSSLRIDRSVLEEVQVISGTFDAEYGQAMSGVVNAVLKRPTNKFEFGGELYTGGFVFPESDDRGVEDKFQDAGTGNLQVNASGPLPVFTKTHFLLSFRRFLLDDYIVGTRTFVPTDSSDFENKVFNPTGDGATSALGYTKEWSGVAKVTNRTIGNVELGYQAIWNDLRTRRDTWAYRLNPEGLPKQETFSIAHGLDWTHTLSKTTFYNIMLRQNYFTYQDMVFEDVYDPGYDAAGPPQGDAGYEYGAFVQGVDFTRFQQTTNTWVGKGDVVSQLSPNNQIKSGADLNWSNLQFGTPGHLIYTTVNGVETLVRKVDEPPDFPGLSEYHPVFGSAYLQDDASWENLRLRAGLRFDYFSARTVVPSDPANPANSIEGAPQSQPQETTPKATLSPRVGLSYPINDRSGLYFAYGHFYQMPGLGQIFTNADYRILENLQAGGIDYGVMGNPDIKPEQTIQYQFGYKHAITYDLGLDLTVFYKDIRDLLGVEFISTYNDAEYARLTNVDFGNVYGFTLELNQRNFGILSTTLNYTWQKAEGNASDPRETATRAEAGEDPRPRLVPFNWDQSHTLNFVAALNKLENWSSSLIVKVASGQPYTPLVEAGFQGSLESNSGRRPGGVIVDLRGEKYFRLVGLGMGVYGRIFNLFDARYFNGFVFNSTGSAFYSRFPVADEVALNDPTRFYTPRRIELGLTFKRF
jgi:outer membrane receptor protein involved in Fe transport